LYFFKVQGLKMVLRPEMMMINANQ